MGRDYYKRGVQPCQILTWSAVSSLSKVWAKRQLKLNFGAF